MSPYFYAAIFIAGMLCAAGPVIAWYEWWEMKAENATLKENIRLEKRNAEIVNSYQDALVAVSDWHRTHPVRVRVPGCETSPGSPPTTLSDIILDLPGAENTDGAATIR